VFLSLGTASALMTREYLTTEPVELLPVGEVLRERAAEGDVLVARKQHLGHLGGVRTLVLPSRGDRGEFLGWLRDKAGARFLYVGPQEVRTRRFLAPWAEGREVPDGLELLHRHEEPPACLYLVR
jgi:hypothetical protein